MRCWQKCECWRVVGGKCRPRLSCAALLSIRGNTKESCTKIFWSYFVSFSSHEVKEESFAHLFAILSSLCPRLPRGVLVPLSHSRVKYAGSRDIFDLAQHFIELFYAHVTKVFYAARDLRPAAPKCERQRTGLTNKEVIDASWSDRVRYLAMIRTTHHRRCSEIVNKFHSALESIDVILGTHDQSGKSELPLGIAVTTL